MSEINTPATIAVNIRLANYADAPALAKLRYALRSSMGWVREPEDEFLKRCGEWMKEHLSAGSIWQCWVAERDEDLIGCLWLQLVEKIPNPRSEPEHHAYITNFFIHERARGKGIASRHPRQPGIDLHRGGDPRATRCFSLTLFLRTSI